jgi:hypothetical protein
VDSVGAARSRHVRETAVRSSSCAARRARAMLRRGGRRHEARTMAWLADTSSLTAAPCCRDELSASPKRPATSDVEGMAGVGAWRMTTGLALLLALACIIVTSPGSRVHHSASRARKRRGMPARRFNSGDGGRLSHQDGGSTVGVPVRPIQPLVQGAATV